MRLKGLRYGIGISIMVLTTMAGARADDGEPQNGLSSQAFRRNALTTNKKALTILRSHALNSALLSDEQGYIARQLEDPNAQAVMAEIVKCALDDQTTLQFPEPPQTRWTWKGELGLCQTWHSGAPSEQCQQLVTACVVARVNALQKAIPLWLRGYPAERPGDEPAHVTTVLRESLPEKDPAEGAPIPSFDQCPAADCGWRASHIGACDAENPTPIELRIDGQPNNSWQMRVCAGIHGCVAPTNPTKPVGSPPYSWSIAESTQSAVGSPSVLSFACPTGLLAGGQYSVMLRNDALQGGTLPDVHASGGVYPDPRKQVFRFLEGAFFGNMFLPEALARDCEVADEPRHMTCRSGRNNEVVDVCVLGCGIASCRRDAGALPYTNVHACYSIVQQQDSQNGKLGVAYLNSRICDRPDASCFAVPPGPCIGDAADSARCTLDATGKFTDCSSPRDRSAKFPPITTYLNERCDLIGEGPVCDEVRKAKPDTTSCWKSWGLVGIVLLVLFVLALVVRNLLPPKDDGRNVAA